MPSMRCNALLDASHHEPPHPFKDAGVVVDSLTGIHNAMVECPFIVNRSCMHKGFSYPHRQKFRGLKSGERGGLAEY
jgi:hypothetical protein